MAPNIYYMGAANVLRFAGLRIAGLSGIFKQHDFFLGTPTGDSVDGRKLDDSISPLALFRPL